jgi:hypothetical protein
MLAKTTDFLIMLPSSVARVRETIQLRHTIQSIARVARVKKRATPEPVIYFISGTTPCTSDWLPTLRHRQIAYQSDVIDVAK